MSGKLTRLDATGSRTLLARVLDTPDLVAAVQALPSQALGKLIGHVGLEDAGELVALATAEQLREIFDDDLWRSPRPGVDETFDADRFLLWLEVMLEAGDAFAAEKLTLLPEDLVTLALHKQVLVIDMDALALVMSERQSDEDALVEKALESCLCEEIGEFRIISRAHDGWDSILSVLLALDRDHHTFLQRLLERCAHVAWEFIEDNGGLYEVLTSEEMLEADAAGEREDRRAESGYVAPSAAASFLALARTQDLPAGPTASERDPITRAYFRQLSPRTTSKRNEDTDTGPRFSTKADPLLRLLREADVLPPAMSERLLTSAQVDLSDAPDDAQEARASEDARLPFSEAIRTLARRDPLLHAERMQELAYLANVLLAGCSLEGRALRPVEAARAVTATCNLALEQELTRASSAPSALVEQHHADGLFRMGWRLLQQALGLPTDQCPHLRPGPGVPKSDIHFIATLAELRAAQREARVGDRDVAATGVSPARPRGPRA
jgi:hypothetical protein